MESDYKRILVTSALPYANGPIHLGHLAGAYLPADIYVRYQRLKQRDVIYICGSDEHGVPITIAAEKKGVSPQVIVDEFHYRNKAAFEKFGMSFDYYGRTSSKVHHETSQEIFLRLHKKGLFNRKTEKQLYDQKAKMFLADRYVKGTCPSCSYPDAYGDQCEKCGTTLSPAELINPKSALTGEKPVYKETEHWYLPLGQLQENVTKWIETKNYWKTNVLGQVKSWLNDGLTDRAVTRDLSWGIPVPLDHAEGKVLYVWFDAPIGYISATKEWATDKGDPDLWKKYWQDRQTKLVHFIGKDNIVFHCIMFPATLMELGDYVLPDNVPANEFLNLEGNKLSTSKNYAVWLEDYVQKFEIDPLRYYLTVNAPETKDADFTWQEFQQRNNSELADILGNFINRTLTFANKQYNGRVPERGVLDDLDKDMLKTLKEAPQQIGAMYETFDFRKAVYAFMDIGRAANKYFNDQEPWRTVKEDIEKCATTINICIHAVQTLAVLMEPLLPFSAEKAWSMAGHKDSVHAQQWDTAGEISLPAGHNLGKVTILFRKFEDSEIQPEIDRLRSISESLNSGQTETKPKQEKPKIGFDEFAKLDLRVARVIEAEKVEKTDKLLKLQLELGTEKRQIVAGVAKNYQPDEMIGKKIIIIANLEPVKIRGIESNGMLLAAEDSEGRLSLLGPDRDVESGAEIH
ncbi:methionine--tRNA ligase [candidate division KSB1 bacterium]|nr:methionine--tRNA ligase [candidate division KSB1 bacterium]